MARICTVMFNDYYSDARVRREIEAFVSRGDEVDCICLPKPGGESVRNLFGARLYFHFLGKFQGRNRAWYLVRHLLFMLDVFFKLCRLQIKRRYDVILIHTLPDYLVFAAAFPKIFGAKIVLDVHELMPEIYSSKYGTGNRLIIEFLTWVEKLSIAFADKAIAVHEPHLEALIKHGNPPEKFGVLLNVPDPKLFQRRVRLRRSVRPNFKLIYHGTIAKRNGVDIALRAFALAKRKIPDMQFCVIGRGDDFDASVELAKQLEIDNSVEFMRAVPLEDLPSYLTDADLGIVSYPYDDFTRYMLPVKLMEYVAVGIPVIVSRLHSITAYFDETMVRYVEPGDEVELANQIVHLCRNPEELEKLVMNATKFTEQHNWEKERQRLFDLFDSLLAPAFSQSR